MADLLHLMDELNEPQEEDVAADEQIAAANTNSQGSAAAIDEAAASLPEHQDEEDEQEDREIIDLPPGLARAAKERHQTGRLSTEDDRLDLEDFAARGDLEERQEYSELQHWWVQELQAPELLPWSGKVIAPMMEAAFSEDEEGMTDVSNLEAIINDIRRVDKERVQFIVANLLQTRLRKIQAYPWFYLQHKDRLSNAEVSLTM